MLKMEEHLGKDALSDELDDTFLESPLDEIYQELGVSGIYGTGASIGRILPHHQFPVYTPKSSSEYFSVMGSVQPLRSAYSSRMADYKTPQYTYKEKSDEDWKKKNRQLLVDYKDFDSAPLSPYLYQSHPYVQKQDSRIVGSNFVQLTTRPKDAFLEKIDSTLANIRSTPRSF